MNEMLLTVAQEAVGKWSPTTINLLIGGSVVIIGSLSAGIVAVIRALSDMKKVVVETKALVDGKYGQVLNQLAEVLEKLADKTGAPDDKAAAVIAGDAAKAQQAVVDKVNGKA